MCSLFLPHRGHRGEERGGSGAHPQAETGSKCPQVRGTQKRNVPWQVQKCWEMRTCHWQEGAVGAVKHPEYALDRKHQSAVLNLDKLNVDTTQSFNTRQAQERCHQRLVFFVCLFCFFFVFYNSTHNIG